ncbi:AAA family ATPase [Rhodococcus sp. Z13]|uniref:AAA family ATPase n=1 Tax=Rhodococcus sacchari TaxID=2962047 RepID=A0ACD4DKH6_9NOCA|nr:AAA family ATPase [Rhodococcus sp. Z13]UYP20540.1 AAA family ATPase [Rhodococcus sp. Z13]
MRRDDPTPALPAWLQEQPSSDTVPTGRRGFRRPPRDGEPTAPPAPEPPMTRPIASVPLGLDIPPRPSAVPDREPEAEPVSAPTHEAESPVAPTSEPSTEVSSEPDPAAEVEAPPVAEPRPAESTAAVPTPPAEPVRDETVRDETVPVETVPVETGSTPVRAPLPAHDDLAADVLVRRSRRASRNWRESVHRLTGGLFDTETARLDELTAHVRQPVSGDYRIAVLSLKGGVGKTTTTVGLGSTFASLRGDSVIAVDANPDFGTLAQRIPGGSASTVRDLLADAANIRRISDVRAHTAQAPSRLEVLASERDPAASEVFGEDDYRRIVDILQVFYDIVLTDCGTGIMHSVMRGVLDLAHTLVLVASPAVDAARSAAATLDWLQAHGYGDLVDRTVVVVSSARPGSANVDIDAITGHFLARCRAVQVLPFDEHLAEGGEIDLDRLRPATRTAFVELAAMVADDFPHASGRHAVR